MKSGLIATRDGRWAFETLIKPWCECEEECKCDDEPAFVVYKPTENVGVWQVARPWLSADELSEALEGRVLPVRAGDRER